jgi:RNA polymerase primary sigma factor
MLDTMVDNNAFSTDKKVDHKQSLEIEVRRCLASLTEREKNVLMSFFGIGMPQPLNLGEIAQKLNMTSERVRQIKDKAIHHLRNPKKTRLLREYLT